MQLIQICRNYDSIRSIFMVMHENFAINFWNPFNCKSFMRRRIIKNKLITNMFETNEKLNFIIRENINGILIRNIITAKRVHMNLYANFDIKNSNEIISEEIMKGICEDFMIILNSSAYYDYRFSKIYNLLWIILNYYMVTSRIFRQNT